jgi:endoglucanase
MNGEVGVNLAGAEFPPRPGIYGKDYLYPNREELSYYKRKGIRLFRIPFSWERMQSTLNGPLDQSELDRLDAVVNAASELHLKLILDVHGYDRYRGKLIGSDKDLELGLADLWRRLAEHYRSSKAVYGYGLMNEPHETNGTWPHTAQIVIDAVRKVDQRHFILLAGDHWSSATTWPESNPKILEVRDPAQRLIYEGHVYFDRDGSGVYNTSYVETGAYPDIGPARVKPFIDWLKANKVNGMIGEFGVPNDDPRWNEVLDRFLKTSQREHISGTYWAGGPRWHNYRLSCEPSAAGDAPQMEVLGRYAKHRRRSWISFLSF